MAGSNTSNFYTLLDKGLDNLSAYFYMKEQGEQSTQAAPIVQEQSNKLSTMMFVIVLLLIIGFFFLRKRF